MWIKYIYIALFIASALGTIDSIGDERPIITKGKAALTVVVNGLLVLGIIYYWK